jgi:hypothetical protein
MISTYENVFGNQEITEIRMTNVDLSRGYQTKSVEIPVPAKCWIRLACSKMGRKNPTKNEYKIIVWCECKIIYGMGSITQKRRAEVHCHLNQFNIQKKKDSTIL